MKMLSLICMISIILCSITNATGQVNDQKKDVSAITEKISSLEKGQFFLKSKYGEVKNQLSSEQLATDSIWSFLKNQELLQKQQYDSLVSRTEAVENLNLQVEGLQASLKHRKYYSIAGFLAALLAGLGLFAMILIKGRQTANLKQQLEDTQIQHESAQTAMQAEIKKSTSLTDTLRSELHSQSVAHKQDWDQVLNKISGLSSDVTLQIENKVKDSRAYSDNLIDQLNNSHNKVHTEDQKLFLGLQKKLELLENKLNNLKQE